MRIRNRADRMGARAVWRAGVAGLFLLWLTPPLAAQTVTKSFPGLDYDTAQAGDGDFRPPDTNIGANGTHVIHATNSAIRLYTTSGTTLATTSLSDFFGSSVAAEKVLFDPRIVYDRLGPNQRFWVVALQRNEDATPPTASIYLAISRSASPTSFSTGSNGSWCTYKIDSVRDKGATWADFPMVGVGADAFLISNDQWTFPPYDYQYAILRVIDKPIATDNALPLNCPTLSSFLVYEEPLEGTDGPNQRNGHVQPAVHYTAPSSFPPDVSNPVYMVSAVAPPPIGSTSTYRVWRVRNVSAGKAEVDVINITGAAYRDATHAKQPGPAGLLDINDSRIMQVAATGDTLWAVHTVGRDQPPPSSLPKPVVRAMAIFVGSSGTPLTAFFQQIVELASSDEDVDLGYYMPGIAVNAAHQIAVPFLTSGPTRYLSAGWAFKNWLDPFFFTQALLPADTPGICKRLSGRLRTGDYVGAQTDPVTLSRFWLAGERAVPDATGVCAWTTHIVEVTP